MTLLRKSENFVIAPDRQETLIDDNGSATERFYSIIQGLVDRIPVYGEGDPNGQIEANKGRLYVDINGSSGSVLYKKDTNGGNTGWVTV